MKQISNKRLPQSIGKVPQSSAASALPPSMASDRNPLPGSVPTASSPRGDGSFAPGAETSLVAERDALYRDNQMHRERPVRLAPGDWDNTTPVSVLGLEQMTISRLFRAGIVRLAQLLEAPVEDLWRSIGRHGINDIMERLAHQGLTLRPLNDYERWRLGLVKPQQIAVTVAPDRPVTDLWPHLGLALTDLLQKRGRFRVADLAPRDQEELLQLYRLGKSNLRKIQTVLEQIAPRAEGAWRERVDRALRLMATRSAHRNGHARRAPPLRLIEETDGSP
jgi:hypothetical protein